MAAVFPPVTEWEEMRAQASDLDGARGGGWLCWVYCTSAAHSTVHTHCARASRVCGVCAPGSRGS
eukprot:scaffold42212_cov64-Phaeocystis_antarctica.AAC.7